MNVNYNTIFTSAILFLEKIKILSPLRLAKIKYFSKFHRTLNLKNPQNLNEKILWLSFNTDTSLWSQLADKYLVRGYVENLGLKDILVPLYGVYDSFDEINFDKLPSSFVLKTNNGNASVILVEDKNNLDKDECRRKLTKWLKIPFGLTTAEAHYRRIRPCIIAEEYLKEDNPISSSLIDYKIWCFNGKPFCVLTTSNRDIERHKVSLNLYSLPEWEPMKSCISESYKNDIDIPKPVLLNKMIEYARILSQGFPQVRIDFYEVEEKIYFGEMTFTSNAGMMTYLTPECLKMMGEKISL